MSSRDRRSVIAQQPVRVLRIVAGERVAGIQALLAAAGDHPLHRRLELDRELANHRAVVELGDAVDRSRRSRA